MVGKHEPSQASKAPLRCAKEGRERQYLTSENTCILRIQQQQNEQNLGDFHRWLWQINWHQTWPLATNWTTRQSKWNHHLQMLNNQQSRMVIPERGKQVRWALWSPWLSARKYFLDCSTGKRETQAEHNGLLDWEDRFQKTSRLKCLEFIGQSTGKEGDMQRKRESCRGVI